MSICINILENTIFGSMIKIEKPPLASQVTSCPQSAIRSFALRCEASDCRPEGFFGHGW